MRSGPGAFPLDVTASNPGAWRVASAAAGGASPGSSAAAAQPLFFVVLGFDAVTGTHLLKRVAANGISSSTTSSGSGTAAASKAGSSSGADVIDYIQVCLVYTLAAVSARCDTTLGYML
jgi:hypothetical protein